MSRSCGFYFNAIVFTIGSMLSVWGCEDQGGGDSLGNVDSETGTATAEVDTGTRSEEIPDGTTTESEDNGKENGGTDSETVVDGTASESEDNGKENGGTDSETLVDGTASESEDNGVVQGPITFVLVNESGALRYLDWSNWPVFYASESPCEREVDGAWEKCQFDVPDCMADCNDESTHIMCYTDCDPFETTRILQPGERIEYQWTGRMYNAGLIPIEGEDRDCGCYGAADPVAGRYRFNIKVYSQISCRDGCDDLDVDGLMEIDPDVDGTAVSQNVTAELDIPYPTGEVIVSIN